MSVRGELHLTLKNDTKIYTLEAARFTIGRGPENALCVPSSVVSRAHAEVIRIGDNYLLRDTGSTNGSFVNGARITEQALSDGDVVRFGHHGPEAVFRLLEAESGEVIALDAHPKGTTESLLNSFHDRIKGPIADVCEEANIRQLLAESHLNKGEHEQALAALATYQNAANLTALPPPFRASVLLLTGRVHLEHKQLDQAIDALERSMHFYRRALDGKGDDAGLAGAHAAMGRALLNTGDLLKAREHLHRALLAARRAGNARLRAEAHHSLGKIDWKEGDFDGARYQWSRAAGLAEESNDALLKGRVQMQRAVVLYTEGKLKEAVPVYEDAIAQLRATGNVHLLLKAYSGLSRVLTRLGSWTAVENLLAERLQLAREHQLAKAEAVALTDEAELRLLQGNLAAAGQAIEAARRRHGQIVYARTQRILGRILETRGQLTEALIALERGLTAARERGALEEQVLIALELALVQAENGELQQARALLETAEAATSLDPALNLMARALYTRGCIDARAGQAHEANRCFSQSLSIFQTVGDPFRAALCHAAIGALRLAQGRRESARAHLEAAQETFARLGAMGEWRRIDGRLGAATLSGVQPAMTSLLPSLSNTAPLSMSHQTGLLTTMAAPVTPRILVAVANDELAAILQRGLEVENYRVERVQSGREAFDRAHKQANLYQLLILDALLEHKSGFDLCRELRQAQRETPVILLGGRQGIEDKLEALQAGADDFLSKRNLVFEELLAKVEALLR
jgi:pSer/pThr/pTyr-binding forkhead associated (FHA) protein